MEAPANKIVQFFYKYFVYILFAVLGLIICLSIFFSIIFPLLRSANFNAPTLPPTTSNSSNALNISLSVHILDSTLGKPATNVAVQLEIFNETQFLPFAMGFTNGDGRIVASMWERKMGSKIVSNTFRITFETKHYFASKGVDTFYPFVQVAFTIANFDQHTHVPLLLNPFGFTTYRGS